METFVLHRVSNVNIPSVDCEADSVKRSHLQFRGDRARAQAILLEAQGYYSAMFRFRNDRERNKRYNYGDQWGDIVCVDGKRMTEEQYIMSQGNIPLKPHPQACAQRDWCVPQSSHRADLYGTRP